MACVNLREVATFALDAFGPKFDAGVTVLKRVSRVDRETAKFDSISNSYFEH